MHRIQAVAFDMDGLLFDTERLAAESWIAAGKTRGIPIGEEMALRTLGLDRHNTRRVFEELYGAGHDYDGIRAERLRYMFDRIERDGMPVKDGVRELLDFLDAARIPYTLATSTERSRAGRYLESAGLAGRFRYRVCGDMVTRGKPEPDIYLQAAKLLGVRPQDALALEDAPLGVEAARRAEMPVVMVPDLVQPDGETRRKTLAVVQSLRDVIPLIRAANAGTQV